MIIERKFLEYNDDNNDDDAGYNWWYRDRKFIWEHDSIEVQNLFRLVWLISLDKFLIFIHRLKIINLHSIFHQILSWFTFNESLTHPAEKNLQIALIFLKLNINVLSISVNLFICMHYLYPKIRAYSQQRCSLK